MNRRSRGLPLGERVFRKHPVLFATAALILLAGCVGFGFFYYKYAMMIEDKFGGGAIRTNSSVYAMPRQVVVGDSLTEAELIARLQRAGYTEDQSNKVGYYRRTPEGVAIVSGPESYFQPHTAIVQIAGNRVARVLFTNRKSHDQSLLAGAGGDYKPL